MPMSFATLTGISPAILAELKQGRPRTVELTSAHNIITDSIWINKATGMIMNEASKLAARTEVVWVEMATAPLTMTMA